MKIILSSLNSKFIHSNLAIRYLANYTKELISIETHEFTINQNIDFITSEIFKLNPDLLGFSVYIWNLNETLRICQRLKKVNPKIQILLGGPEVSFEELDFMKAHPYIDYIISGEGEESFKDLVKNKIQNKASLEDIPGLIFRENNKVVKNIPRPLKKDLDTIPSPYKEVGKELKNKIVYYESSRGCPFNCAFCLSSTVKGVRYFGMDRIKDDLSKLIEAEVRQVKFVDRTFNANKLYAMEIMQFIIDKDPKDMNFHFEVTADLIDEEMLEFLGKVKEGLFQFEIGVQSTNHKTLSAIDRFMDFEKISQVTRRIKSYSNIHQHLDLIAGLPYEDYNSFSKSFNDVYALKPEKLQLGFLKLLKGSGLRFDESKYGYKYIDEPPYEVLENHYIDYKDIIKLKGIEDLVEKYYNGSYFQHTLEFIIKNYYENAFEFYEDLALYWEEKGYNKVSHSRNKLYEILLNFSAFKEHSEKSIIKNLLKYDYISNNIRPRLPKALQYRKDYVIQDNIHNILKDERVLEKLLTRHKDMPTKKLINLVSIEAFDMDILKIIEKDYNIIDENKDIYILFEHLGKEINRCNVYNITKVFKELV